jgi:uncharacterized RDD family membrane protein YckC
MSDSNSEVQRELVLAKWEDRFVAWLIDFLIISSISAVIFTSIFGTWDTQWYTQWDENIVFSEGTSFIPASLLFFGYWMIFEYKGGQSIGKKILHLKVVNIDGESSTLLGVMISSFGKSFLLPIDFILGIIFTNKKRQRIFNRIGDTIVLKIQEKENDSENITYVKD